MNINKITDLPAGLRPQVFGELSERIQEIHLFIFWDQARSKQDTLLGSINSKFKIIDVVEILAKK